MHKCILLVFTLISCLGTISHAYRGCIPGQYGSGYNFKCYTRVELAFVIDASHSVNVKDPRNFDMSKEFVKNIVKGFEVLDTLTRVGIVSYSNNAHVQMRFTQTKDQKDVLRKVDGIPFQNSGTKLGQAILSAGELFNDSREKVRKVLIIISHGGSVDDEISAARQVKATGVEIFSIGVGDHYRKKELLATATDGRHVFTSQYKTLKAIQQKIKDMVCSPPTITYQCQCDCCGSVYTCTNDDMNTIVPCACSG